MHKFLRTMTAAAVAAAMAPAYAADATYNVDVVVVGAGAAGTAAGWAVAEKGLKVVTLEKQAMVGGTGKFSEGIFAVESSMQRNWNYGLTKDEAFQKIMNYGHWRGNAKMVRAFVDKSGETIDWMQANGVKFEKLFSNYPNGLYTWHIYEGRGAGWINLFQQKYKDAGQTLLLNTWGKELIQDKNGTVKGVVATNKNGDKITVNAKATIIATGGFNNHRFSGYWNSETDMTHPVILARIPVRHPWEVFAHLPFGNWNDCPDTPQLMAVARYWFEKFGAVPAVMTHDELDFALPKPIGRELAVQTALEQYVFCPDMDQNHESVGALADTLRQSKIWYFWWD